MKKMKWLLSIALTLLLLSGLTVFSFAAEAEDTEDTVTPPPTVSEGVSEYGLYVNGIAVNETNKDSILEVNAVADAPLAHAAYDADSRTLTFSGNVTLNGCTRADGGIAYSILSVSEDEIEVVVEESTTLTMSYGVYLYRGSFKAQGANLTFDMPNSGSAAFMQVMEGDITVTNCHVECTSAIGITVFSDTEEETKRNGCGFVATRIAIDNTWMELSSQQAATPMYALFYGIQTVSITGNSTITSDQGSYLADAFVMAEESVTVSDSLLYIMGVGCVFDLPKAELMVSDSKILGTVYHGMTLGGESRFKGTTEISLKTVHGGIYVTGKEAAFIAGNVKIHMFETAITHDDKGAAYRTRPHVWETIPQAAIYADGTDVSFSGSSVESRGYLYGILYISRGEKFSFTGKLNLAGETAAFMAVTDRESDIGFGSSMTGDAYADTLHAPGVFGELGQYVTSFVPNETKLTLRTSAAVQSPEGVAGAVTGYLKSCNIKAEEFPAAIIIIPCIILIALTVLILVLYQGGYLMAGRRKKKQGDGTAKDSDKTEETASEAVNEDPTTDNSDK